MTSGQWREHPEARAELLAQSDRFPVDIAEDLLASSELAVVEVLEAPDSWPKLPDWDQPPTLRHRKINPFRINVLYYVGGDEVRVIAYAHERREPRYWAERLDDWAE